ncbi:M28 family peptidase [Flavobacterium crassostreae]|uniref:Peptidase M28 n=1 Tax=Flavobacterium crassostreae TaxID=1763534 RepID=A0A1B9DKI8_9FLAO|nr:M28 family peptidase [Flavobacterium crassostreae]OCB70220.1 peptidase M28 [Flavobacterium crassostreae]
MKKIIPLIAIALSFSCSSTQTTVEQNNSNPTKYLNSITVKDLKKHLFIVANDSMEGRETGSEGQKRAGNYLIEQYKSNAISYPKAASSFYQKVPAAFLNKKYHTDLKDSENIWAFIEGTEKPEEIIVISAHYDHIGIQDGDVYNGADDDGSGTVALLEIAQAFALAKKEGHGPKRSILFFHATGEEHGLLGSSYYSENPLYPLANTITNINIDMIGRRDEIHPNTNNYVYLIGADRLSTQLDSICKQANDKYIHLDLDYRFNDKNDPNHFYERSDHYNFAKHGIPSAFLFNGVHADYHQKTDTPDKIEFDALAKRTQLAFVIAWELANGQNRPVVDVK